MVRSPQQRLGPSVGAAAALVLALALGADAFGCSRDHGFLAATSSTGSSGGGRVTTSASSSGSGGAGTGGENVGGEPPGPSRLTVLDAIVDEDAVRLCFVPYPGGDAAAEPWPGAAGLAYGGARVIDGASGVIPKSTDVLAIVIGGDLSQTSGKTCDEIVAEAGMSGSGGGGGASASSGSGGGGGAGGAAPGPPFIAVSLGVLPASAFAAKRSLLLATAGCLGGAGHDDPNAALVCGTGYAPTNPTARLAALALSRRVSPGHLALQVVQASLATPDLMVDIAPTKSANAVLIAPSLPYGGAEPEFAYAGFSAGALSSDGQIFAYSLQGGPPLATTPLGDALAGGDSGGLLDGHAYALVAIGPSPSLGAGPWWHAFTWTTVRSDP